MDEFVGELGGLDAAIAEEGKNLSGGQRQRIALARALLHDTPVYIFDEATSNVDAESEHAIIETVHELAKRKTVVMISHRLSAVAAADEIYVMESGQVAEHGSHEQLLAAEGVYAKLWNQQVELESLAAADGVQGLSDELDCAAPEARVARAVERSGRGNMSAAGAEDLPEASPSATAASTTSTDGRVAASGNRHPEKAAGGKAGSHSPVGDAARSGDVGRPITSHASVMVGLAKLVRPLAGWMVLAVLKALRSGKGDRTVILVSHRPSTAALADQVITVEHGRVS